MGIVHRSSSVEVSGDVGTDARKAREQIELTASFGTVIEVEKLHPCPYIYNYYYTLSV